MSVGTMGRTHNKTIDLRRLAVRCHIMWLRDMAIRKKLGQKQHEANKIAKAIVQGDGASS